MKRFKSALSVFFVLAILGTLLWLAFKAIVFLCHFFSSLNPNVVMAIIAGSATIVASTLAVVLTRYYQSKKDREVAHRDRKIELYDALITRLFSIFVGGDKKEIDQETFVPFLREIHRKLILWSGPKVITAYAEWHKVLITTPPRAVQMVKMIDFFLALREDLGHSNKGIQHDHIVRFILQNSDLFMQEYRKDPNVTFEEITELEKKLGLASTPDP